MSKKHNKFMVGAVTAAMVATAVAPVAGAEVNANADTYSDVSVENSHFDNIYKAKDLGLLQGYPDATFKPAQTLTRSNVVKALGKYVVKASGKTIETYDVSGVTPFNDVPETIVDKELYNYSLVVKKAGIFSGDSNNLNPLNDITRQQMAKVLVNTFDLKDLAAEDSKVTDNDEALAEYVPYINILSENGVTNVEEFMPKDDTTRAQFASFLVRSYEASETPVVTTPEVASVSAINAAQFDVKFNSAVAASSVIDTDGTIKNGVLSLTVIDGNGAPVVTDAGSLASLSADGKTLTVTLASGQMNDVKYVVTVNGNTVETKDGQFIPKFTSNVLTATDTVAPAVSNVIMLDASNVRVVFSEPLSSAGNWSFKLANGNTVAVNADTTTLAEGYVDLAIGAVDAGVEITGTIIGATDYANNLISPNPVTIKFSKGQLDGTKPAVSSITPLGLNMFEVKLTEEVQDFTGADISIDGGAVLNDVSAGNAASLEAGEAKVSQSSIDKTKYTVELGTALSAGIHSVGIAKDAVSDLSGETNNAFSRVVEFEADTTAPELVKSEVKTESGVEFLYLTFNEAVDAATLTSLDATQLNNYVTVDGTIDLSSVTPVAGSAGKQYKVALSDIDFTDDATSTTVEVVKGATYTAVLTNGFEDKSDVALETTSVTFTRGGDTDISKPALVKTVDTGESTPQVTSNGIDVINNDTFQVTFDEAVDGATATNKANYRVNGASVKSATLLPGNIVEVKFEANTITLDGLRNVTISGVKSSAGVLMDSYTTSEYFVENVEPTVSSATLVEPNQVKVVFSEPVNVSTVSAEDLDVYVGSTVETEGTGFTVAAEATTPGTRGSSYIVTLEDDLLPAEYAQTLTVRVVNGTTNTIVDAKGNNVVTGVYSIQK